MRHLLVCILMVLLICAINFFNIMYCGSVDRGVISVFAQLHICTHENFTIPVTWGFEGISLYLLNFQVVTENL